MVITLPTGERVRRHPDTVICRYDKTLTTPAVAT